MSNETLIAATAALKEVAAAKARLEKAAEAHIRSVLGVDPKAEQIVVESAVTGVRIIASKFTAGVSGGFFIEGAMVRKDGTVNFDTHRMVPLTAASLTTALPR